MKRSTTLRLTLMAASLPVALSACDDPAPPEPAYQAPIEMASAPTPAAPVANDLDCNSAEAMATDQCKLALESAIAQAPRYLTREACVEVTGSDCVQLAENGGVQWMPTLMGFAGGYILAEAIDEIGDAAFKRRTRNSPYRDYYRSRPVYPVARSTGYSSRATLPPPAPTRAITTSRSGFGSTATARSSFGG